MNLISKDGEIKSLRWRSNGHNYRISGTDRGKDYKVWSSIDHYINESTGRKGSYTRREMAQQFKNVEIL